MVRTQTHSNLWIRCLSPRPEARLRLFCFSHAGGGAASFRTWGQALPAEIEVCAVQLPGRENRIREPAFDNLGALLPPLLKSLHPYLDKPFAFLGHSMGTILCYEVALHLQRTAQPAPFHVFVSGRQAPHIQSQRTSISLLSDVLFLDELQRRYKGIPAVVLEDAELRSLMLPFLRADFTLVEKYQPVDVVPLHCPLSAFGGSEDDSVRREDLEAWRMYTLRDFTLQMFPGDHFYLHQNPAPLLQLIGPSLLHSFRHSVRNQLPFTPAPFQVINSHKVMG